MKKNVKASLQAHQLLHWDMQGEKNISKRKCFLVAQMGINSIENRSICGLGIINDIKM